MTINDLLGLLQAYGTPGMLLAFLIWDRSQQNRINKERTAADLDMARAITLLAAKIDHVR